jgi:outer membrane cobalamin receptor
MIQTNIWAPLDLSLRLKKNFYTVKEMGDNAKAINKPGIETDIRATFEATNALRFTLNYYFAGDRWANFGGTDIKMNNINDLNFGATYRITDFLSVNLKANNLLFQKYDIWYGFPAQGFNAMGGFTFKF